MNRKYKNWIWFLGVPLAFILVLELICGWPYNGKIVPESSSRYIEVTITLTGLVLFAALVGLGVNFWHYRRVPEDKRIRSIQMVASIITICVDYTLGKLMLFLTSMTYEQFVATTGIKYVNSRMVDQSLSGLLLLYFLFQCLFAAFVLMRHRTKMQESRS